MSDVKAVYFPRLHPELAPDLPDGVVFLDPGLEPASQDGGEAGRLRPASLPVGEAEARMYLTQALNFGEMFKSKGEIAHYGVAGLEDFYTGSTMSVLSDLSDKDKGVRPDTETPLRRKAQALLILNAAVESRILEIRNIDAQLKAQLEKFETSLGLDEDNETLPGLSMMSMSEAAAPIGAESFEELRLPWKLLLEAYFTLLDPAIPLLTADPDLIECWQEDGLTLAPAEGVFTVPEPGRMMVVCAPAWKLLGRRRQPATSDPAWLAGERTMYCLLPV